MSRMRSRWVRTQAWKSRTTFGARRAFCSVKNVPRETGTVSHATTGTPSRLAVRTSGMASVRWGIEGGGGPKSAMYSMFRYSAPWARRSTSHIAGV